MIKIMGLAFIVLSCSAAGIYAASGLSRRTATLERLIRLHCYLRDSLRYLSPSVTSLIGRAAAEPEFLELGFLSGCDKKMRSGKSFPDSWREAVEEWGDLPGREEADIVSRLGGVLGARDLESQLAALEHGAALLGTRLEEAREYALCHRKLYRTLGVLAGLFIAVTLV